jgi:fluoride exporter
MTVLAVMLAGGLGAVARFLVDGAVKHRWSPTVPWATIAINVTGSLLLGVLAGAVIFSGAPGDLQQIVGTGFCGGYTTFSTASFETVRLVQQRRSAAAAANAIGTLLAAVAACAAGLALAWGIGSL